MTDFSKGLYIENLQLLIPWGITNEEAWRIGNPAPWNLPDDTTRMKWEGVVILGGLECVIQTWFPSTMAKLSQFNVLTATQTENNPQVWADILKAKCGKLFGQQSEHGIWRQDKVTFRIGHDDRFVEAYWLEIALK